MMSHPHYSIIPYHSIQLWIYRWGKKNYQPGQPGHESFGKGGSRQGEDDSQSWEEAMEQAGKQRIM